MFYEVQLYFVSMQCPCIPFITTLFLFYFAYCENLLFLQPKNPDWNEVVGWDGKLSVSRVGASEPKFEGHLTCTGWVLGGAVWQRADAKSRWRGRLLWSFGTRRATIKSTLMTEARLGWDFHSGAWIIFGIPFLDYPLGWHGLGEFSIIVSIHVPDTEISVSYALIC